MTIVIACSPRDWWWAHIDGRWHRPHRRLWALVDIIHAYYPWDAIIRIRSWDEVTSGLDPIRLGPVYRDMRQKINAPLGKRQKRLLVAIRRFGGACESAVDLGTEIGVEAKQISGIARGLERRGLVYCRLIDTHRLRIWFTDRGREVADNLPRTVIGTAEVR